MFVPNRINKIKQKEFIKWQYVARTIDTITRFDLLLEKYEQHKALRILAWVNGFIYNCCYPKQKDPLATSEIEKQRKFYTIREQSNSESSRKFQNDKKHLNLVRNVEDMYEC